MLEDRTVLTSISGLSPAYGPTTGGTTVSISGSDFTGATAVYFGTALYGNMDVVNDNLIYVYNPPHAAGVVDVTVVAPGGTSPITAADQFTYTAPPPPPAPVVTGLSPNSGSTAGGAYVQIDGSGFTGATGVSFGGLAATSFYTMGDSVINAYDPAEAAGMVDVRVTTAGGTSATSSADQFTYATPPPASTWTYLSSSANPTTFGQTLTLTATVSNGGSGTPTGTVEFDDGGNVLGTATLTQGMMGGQATLTISSLTVGPHSLTALYYGDSANAGSTSSVLNQAVQQAPTTTTLTSNVSSSEAGQAVTFTAEVDGQFGGAPTGTVTFKDASGATLGTAYLSPGGNGSQATLTVSTLPAGTDAIAAVYGGDVNFGASTSSTLNHVVQNNGAFVWTGALSTDWDKAGNWLVDGVTATSAPNEADDVIFSGVGELNHDCATDAPDVTVTVRSLTLESAYTGTLTLNTGLDLTAGMDMEGGNINQPAITGVSTDITVGGAFNWAAGVLNVGTHLANIILNNSATLKGTNLTTGDALVLDGMTLSLSITGNLTFSNGAAGITMNKNAQNQTSLWKWDSKTANIVTSPSSTGIFQNNGGTLLISTGGAPSVVTSDLPYDNEGGTLRVQIGKLVFDRAGPSGYSVAQNYGSIFLGEDNMNGAVMEVDHGLLINLGILWTAQGKTSKITVGDIKINGGTIKIGGAGWGELDCDGLVTMSGGMYAPTVDFAASKSSIWLSATGFDLSNTATLLVNSVHIPNPLPVKKAFPILQTLAANCITGDFATKTLNIGATGMDYTAATDPTNQNYDATTP